jgi:hypothetical protein
MRIEFTCAAGTWDNNTARDLCAALGVELVDVVSYARAEGVRVVIKTAGEADPDEVTRAVAGVGGTLTALHGAKKKARSKTRED